MSACITLAQKKSSVHYQNFIFFLKATVQRRLRAVIVHSSRTIFASNEIKLSTRRAFHLRRQAASCRIILTARTVKHYLIKLVV
jgi:hypothetical protein